MTSRARSVLLGTAAVQALQRRRKSQMRVPIWPLPTWHSLAEVDIEPGAVKLRGRRARWACGLGRPGDRLLVRETYSPDFADLVAPSPPVWYRADFSASSDPRGAADCRLHPVEAAQPSACLRCAARAAGRPFRWRSGGGMPLRYSRWTLVIEDVQPQRLRSLTEADAVAEGHRPEEAHLVFQNDADGRPRLVSELCATAVGAFVVAWQDHYQHRDPRFGWLADPWVWAVRFSVA